MANTVLKDCLKEVVAKLRNGGLPEGDIENRYGSQRVSPGLSTREFLQLLQLDGSLEKRGNRFYFKTNSV